MYAALWRVLPGPGWVKLVELVVLATGIVALLVEFVFPIIAVLVFAEESTLGQ
jgi:hypothetical protein